LWEKLDTYSERGSVMEFFISERENPSEREDNTGTCGIITLVFVLTIKLSR